MVRAFVALGSNLGDRAAFIRRAVLRLHGTPRMRVLRVAPVFETAPVGPAGQGSYLNSAVELAVESDPAGLLRAMLEIEAELGRDRVTGVRWGPRTIDLDLLLYADTEIDEPGLTVPHPRLAERVFVLDPLAALAPDLVVPGVGRTVGELLASVRHGLEAGA
ncbi:MAG: 2-amino-4-hydroxy-6-hydroxymethyldihydropteridine diphosphokinase [Phycisphaerales bacterium]